MNPLVWKPRATMVLSVIKSDRDLWFSAKTLAALFGVTTQNIQIHIRDLQEAGQTINSASIAVEQAEGMRLIKRKIKHYPFETAHAIAIRSQRFHELQSLYVLARQQGFEKPAYRIAPIKERAFSEILLGVLEDITPVLRQYHLPPYFIDFFLPEWQLAIEYDERHHSSPGKMRADAERQSDIEKSLGAKFVRVAVGKELEALNRILKIGIRMGGIRNER